MKKKEKKIKIGEFKAEEVKVESPVSAKAVSVKEAFSLNEAISLQEKGYKIVEVKSQPKKTWVLTKEE